MRIISQDGLREVEYESCGLAVNPKCCEIEAYTCYTDFTPVMASYSSVEKCKKALEMLHEKYREVTIYPFSNKSSTVPPKTFQFPADSEVEVSE